MGGGGEQEGSRKPTNQPDLRVKERLPVGSHFLCPESPPIHLPWGLKPHPQSIIPHPRVYKTEVGPTAEKLRQTVCGWIEGGGEGMSSSFPGKRVAGVPKLCVSRHRASVPDGLGG